MAPLTKGEQTRRRIVEHAAPVFNRRGYVGASMRDLIDATGLEKGGIYNHFGSKEQLALEAYDFAMTRVTEGLARSQDGATDAPDRLVRMIRSFATAARHPVLDGGCPIMNTAIEADDTHPELLDRARASMTLWHRLIGRTVKDGVAAGTVTPARDVSRAVTRRQVTIGGSRRSPSSTTSSTRIPPVTSPAVISGSRISRCSSRVRNWETEWRPMLSMKPLVSAALSDFSQRSISSVPPGASRPA